MNDIKEVKFTPSFEIGEIVYDVTNNARGVVVCYVVDKRDITYRVKFDNGFTDTCYKVQLSLNKYIE